MTSSLGKRIKTVGNKRKEPERPYSNKFLSRRHEQHFLTIQDRRLLMERKAGWILDLAPQFGEELKSRKWERIATEAIDEAYYRQYCGGDEVAWPVLPRRPSGRRGPRQAHAARHDAEPFQMRDMYMSLMEDKLQSIHRGQVATVEMIIGMYDASPGRRWTMDEFNNVVAWPEEQAHGSGSGATEAPALEEDDEDDDDFEDAKEGEEEDYDDSMG
ncbi:hypothetical protein LR48_Vigan04g099100 [Vigna angularis]|uniref:Uncharacterized protein n=1 Tax=Phaseolus angularis TaxID=3914 RepID=A0A0L9UDF7_PHAAN|nr:hypothetical protein LR48_Vigan04g099100 [Vigna angularis]